VDFITSGHFQFVMQAFDRQKDSLQIVVTVCSLVDYIQPEVDFGVRENCHTVSMNER
jgi:hypothetical protein